MFQLTLGRKVLILFTLITAFSFGREYNSTTHQYYKVGPDATITIDFQHTELSILPSSNDSLSIHTRIRVTPTNTNAPFAGITVDSERTGEKSVSTKINIGDEIQPHNDLKANCEIFIPKNTHLKIYSRYGIIYINAPSGKLDASISYTNLTSDSLSQHYSQSIVADYSTVICNKKISNLSFEGKNSNLKASEITHLESKTEFSMIDITKAESITTNSYSDRFLLSNIDSVNITSQKSLFQMNTLTSFLQGEMKNGTLMIENIQENFNNINIANSQVKSILTFNKGCNFTLNADMKYCSLNHPELNIQEISSPNGNLYSGGSGKSENVKSNISIISAYGDVSLLLK